MAKSPFISFEAETSRTIFKSKKYEKKSAKNAFPVYGWASKSLQKWYILHAKSWLCCYVKITIFHLSRYTDGAKRVTKNHSFLTSKLMFCYVKNRHFHRSTCVDAVKKCTTDMHFSLKIDHFSYKNHTISMKNQCFHTSRYIDDHQKTCNKSLIFSSEVIFFHSKTRFSSFPVCRWSKKCCKIVHFHLKLIEKCVHCKSV